MLYFWILTVLLFALPIGLAVLTWNQSQADARACVIRWQVIASVVYFLATSPMNLTTDTIFVYGLYWLISLAILGVALFLRHTAENRNRNGF